MTPNQLSYNQPAGGVAVHIFGNYGSTVFDPIGDAQWLEAALCDQCLASAIADERVLHVMRSPPETPPPPTYRTATPENIADNPDA